MKPIKLITRTEIKEVKSDDITSGYDDGDVYFFMPEFLEECYTEPNGGILRGANKTLEHYANIRDKLEYIGTEICDVSPKERVYLEHYFDKDGNVVIYLISKPNMNKYYPSLQMISIKKLNGGVVV